MSVRLRNVLIGTLSVGVMLFLLACGTSGQQSEANKLVQSANKQIDQYNKLDSELKTLVDEATALPTTQEGGAKGLALTGQMKAKLDGQKGAIDTAKGEFEKVKKLDVSETYKTYITMKIDECNVLTELNGVFIQMVGELEKLYQQLATNTATTDSIAPIQATINQLSDKGNELDKKRQGLSDKAKKYYEEKLSSGK